MTLGEIQTEKDYLSRILKSTGNLPINHNYLLKQFADYHEILERCRSVIEAGHFTMGKELEAFEQKVSELCGTKHAIGVGSGTDALLLSLKCLDIGPGDEVITTPYTFFATVGAIVRTGATPIFVDIQSDLNINSNLIERAITRKTKAILPVHWGGLVCDMDRIMALAQAYGLRVIEDACQAIDSRLDQNVTGSFGDTGCFSLHPLKNLNVWGDGGFITTQSSEIANRLYRLRNHGLVNRDVCFEFGYNSRLDEIQAVVANCMMEKLNFITESRIKNANYFDQHLRDIPEITVPARSSRKRHVFHMYNILCKNRDDLKEFLINHGIDAKIYYPVPMHLQPAAKDLGYKKGDFPVAENVCNSVLALPVHEFISMDQQDSVVSKIRQFYS